ncbi:DUF1761 domain-containing protein [Paenibacillus lemnae]|uniref:DUF1761 domain-containing protein n=1 Tax=Paenibacillus lemnae TaxID=1330551 RepID=A0A848M297_PAELE|nr:DUF1761 domain-containing protein [Paenibacillus lemnae]NMO94252.1 DUF1761 domain-containing protein [Paenibacillus lemnae]
MIDWGSINYLPVVVGAMIYIVYGGGYYSILLTGKKGDSHGMVPSKGPFKYIYSIIIAWVSSYLLAVLVQSIDSAGVMTGALIGFIIGMIITMVYLKNYLFGLMGKTSFLTAIGDHLVIFTLLGAVHGAFI